MRVKLGAHLVLWASVASQWRSIVPANLPGVVIWNNWSMQSRRPAAVRAASIPTRATRNRSYSFWMRSRGTSGRLPSPYSMSAATSASASLEPPRANGFRSCSLNAPRTASCSRMIWRRSTGSYMPNRVRRGASKQTSERMLNRGELASGRFSCPPFKWINAPPRRSAR